MSQVRPDRDNPRSQGYVCRNGLNILYYKYNIPVPDEHETVMLVAWGWNGMQSHQMPRAPKVLRKITKSSDKLLVVVDPRKSGTAEIADIHLSLAPGTDALPTKTMISIILKEGWENRQYIESHVEGVDQVRGWFTDSERYAALAVCRLEKKQVMELCRLMTSKKWCVHTDLGVYMGRHSAVTSYLINMLAAVCGIIGVRGGISSPA